MITKKEIAEQIKNEQYDRDSGTIQSLRHHMHVCSDAMEYRKMLEKLEEMNIEGLNLISFGDYLYCSDDCFGDNCYKCSELEEERMDEIKEENNSIIEEWMHNVESEFELGSDSFAPSGMARIRWMESA